MIMGSIFTVAYIGVITVSLGAVCMLIYYAVKSKQITFLSKDETRIEQLKKEPFWICIRRVETKDGITQVVEDEVSFKELIHMLDTRFEKLH